MKKNLDTCGKVTGDCKNRIMEQPIEKIIRELVCNQQLRNWVWKMVRKDGGNRQDAESIFLKTVRIVWENLERGEKIDNLTSFVKTVARKNWNQEHKRTRLRRERLKDLDVPDGTASVEISYISKELIALFWQGIQELKKPCADILSLALKEGLSHRQISKRMDNGKDADWVKRRAYDCRKELRDWLQQQPEFKDLL